MITKNNNLKQLIRNILKEEASTTKNILMQTLPAAVESIREAIKSPEFLKVATGGILDGDVNDDKIQISTAQPIPAKNLIPTQKEIGFKNSVDDAMTNIWGCIDQAFGPAPVYMPSKPANTAILVAKVGSEYHVLDGHHRWSLAYMINPDAVLACDVLVMPSGTNQEDALKIMQLAIGALAHKVITKGLSGQDLMTTNKESLIKYVNENLTDMALEVWKSYRPELNSKDKVANHMAAALNAIQKNIGPYSRIYMPQAGDSGVPQDKVNKALEAGEIDWNEPFTTKTESLKRRKNKIREIREAKQKAYYEDNKKKRLLENLIRKMVRNMI